MTSPLIVWAHKGRVVDLPTWWAELDNDEILPALSDHGTWSGLAFAGSSSSCRPETLVNTDEYAQYDNERAGGRYELIVMVVDPEDSDPGNAPSGLLVSDPITVDLESGVPRLP